MAGPKYVIIIKFDKYVLILGMFPQKQFNGKSNVSKRQIKIKIPNIFTYSRKQFSTKHFQSHKTKESFM